MEKTAAQICKPSLCILNVHVCIQTYFFNFMYSGLCHEVCLTTVTSFRAKVI